MRIACLRHGETEESRVGRYSGARQSALIPRQREALLEFRFDHSIYDAVFSSPVHRCLETAECLGLPRWTIEDRIKERDFGVFEGLTPGQCQANFPSAYAKFAKFEASFVIPGGESRAQHWARIFEWIQEIFSIHENVLAVTHGGSVDFLYRLATNRLLHGGDEIYCGGNANLSTFDIRWPEVDLIEFDVSLADRLEV